MTDVTRTAAQLKYVQGGVGSVVRSITSKFQDGLNVRDFGAQCDGSTDDSAAFQAAVNATGSTGMIAADGPCVVNTAPVLGKKNIYWNFGPNIAIKGRQTAFPRMFTNHGIPAVGPWIQSQSPVVSPAGDAYSAFSVETLPPTTLAGGVISIFAGTNLTGNGKDAIATAQNLVATAQNGSSGNIWGQEIDVGMFAPTGTGTQFGLSLNGLGTGNPTFGVKIDRSDKSKWQFGLDIRNAQVGVNIENTSGMNNALVAGTIPTIFAGTTAMIGQMANGGSALILQRYTNTAPGGYLIKAINANNTEQLFSVDIGGQTFAKSLAASGTVSHGAQEIDKSYSYNTPSSGQVVTMAADSETAIIDPASTLAALTVTLPACTPAHDGSIARYSSTRTISALTVNSASGTVSNMPTTLAAGAGHASLCRGANTTWYPLY
ncbi:glycosyl hydrolase family 28-related protein [Paraburkholderia sediminicola]|uniref:glycosyl hydrolase family 28-related protein n=1 Tax=Paraburkholderia sediminicola TaxID=458836 RepID=UPI0038B97651